MLLRQVRCPFSWGNPEITKEFNAGSFINCNDYGLTEKGELEIIERIVQEVIRIDKDQSAYIAMLKHPHLRLRMM